MCCLDVETYVIEVGVDSISAILLFLVGLVRLVVLVYSGAYLSLDTNYHQYVAFMLIFILRMVGLLVSFNWVILLLSWEVLGLSSFFLINFNGS